MEKSYSQQDIKGLKNRAEAGDAEAQELYGIALNEGNGIEIDEEGAYRWFERAADQGKPRSQANLGWGYLSGRVNGEQNSDKGLPLLEAAMEGGYPSAFGSMAVAYMGGLGVEQDIDKAISLARTAYEKGGRNRDGMILVGAILQRDSDDMDLPEMISILESVAADESEHSKTREQAEAQLETLQQKQLLSDLFDDFDDFKNGEGTSDIDDLFAQAAREINERPVFDMISPSQLMQRYVDTFRVEQEFWYETYADNEGNSSTNGGDFDYENDTVIVEGEEIAYLVLDKDGKVQKLHPAFELDDESLLLTEKPVVMSMANINDNIVSVRYLPGRDGYPYLTWTGEDSFISDQQLLAVIDESLGSVRVNLELVNEVGEYIYQMLWGWIQDEMNEEGYTLSNIRQDLTEASDAFAGKMLDLQKEDEVEPVDYGEGKTGFAVRQDMLSAGMMLMNSSVQRAVDENDVGNFPFYVLCGDKEVLAIVHAGGKLENLEEAHELPQDVYDQEIDGFTLDVTDLLGFPLRFIPVL